jgi:hypothetical protein
MPPLGHHLGGLGDTVECMALAQRSKRHLRRHEVTLASGTDRALHGYPQNLFRSSDGQVSVRRVVPRRPQVATRRGGGRLPTRRPINATLTDELAASAYAFASRMSSTSSSKTRAASRSSGRCRFAVERCQLDRRACDRTERWEAS